jgi:uncharacterized protein YkwD
MIGFIIGGVAIVLFGLYKAFFKKKEKGVAYIQTIIQYPKESDADYILNELNKIRVYGNNLNPLLADATTTNLARRRNREMILEGVLSHKLASDEFGELLNLGADSVGEIIGYKYKTAEAVVNAWGKSAGHYKEIVKEKYDWCGVDVEVDNDGIKWYCVIFGNDDKTN